jgi:hypothetical protein
MRAGISRLEQLLRIDCVAKERSSRLDGQQLDMQLEIRIARRPMRGRVTQPGFCRFAVKVLILPKTVEGESFGFAIHTLRPGNRIEVGRRCSFVEALKKKRLVARNFRATRR